MEISMKMNIIYPLMCASVLLALPMNLAAAGLTPGLYEYSIKMNMPGAPANMPAQTAQRCLTAKEVEGNKSFEMPPDGNTDCKVNGLAQTASQFSYTIGCTKPQKMDGAVKGTFTATSMAMDMTITMAGAPGPMTQTITAKRISDCK
jgi:hypothetical protein